MEKHKFLGSVAKETEGLLLYEKERWRDEEQLSNIDAQINLCLVIAKSNGAKFRKANPLIKGDFLYSSLNKG